MNFLIKTSAVGIAALAALIAPDVVFAADLPAFPTKAAPIVDVPFFSVNDNRLTYAIEPNGTDPNAASKTLKQSVAYTHFDRWRYGTNFVNLQLIKSDKADPAAPCGNFQAPVFGCAGAVEFYGTLRSTLGFNEIFDTRAFTAGPLRNISFILGVDGEVENVFLAPNKKVAVAGIQFAFDLPYKGFFNVSPLYYQEWGHNTFVTPTFVPHGFTGLPDGNTKFAPTWAVEVGYYMDLGFLPPNLQYFAISGRASFIGPKGNGAYDGLTVPSAKTAMEINSEPVRLTFDVSKLVWGDKYNHFVETWVAYRYWKNKFGLDDDNPSNKICYTAAGVNNGTCTEKSVYAGVTVKF